MNQTSRLRYVFMFWLGLSMIATPMAQGQSVRATDVGQSAPSVVLLQGELDALLAPIALYPDQLLAQILMASTYPLEVVAAARFVQENPTLTGAALDQALQDKRWDPSVLSLAVFPQVLLMMNDKLEWMQQLGDAFLANSQQVMDTVQSLRLRAEAAGNLQSSLQQVVTDQDGAIVIEPAQPEYIYVPAYDPREIYGPWSDPVYMPWYWLPPPLYGYPVYATASIVFGTAYPVSANHWGWARPDWHGHHININATNNHLWSRPGRPPPPPGGTWQHQPGHRGGVAYPDAATSDRFMRVDPNAVRARQEFRGRELTQPARNVVRPSPNVVGPSPNLIRPTPTAVPPASDVARPAPSAGLPTPQMVRPIPRPTAPTFDPGLSRQQTQMNAERGLQSRQSIGPTPQAGSHAPSGSPAPQGGARQR